MIFFSAVFCYRDGRLAVPITVYHALIVDCFWHARKFQKRDKMRNCHAKLELVCVQQLTIVKCVSVVVTLERNLWGNKNSEGVDYQRIDGTNTTPKLILQPYCTTVNKIRYWTIRPAS